MANYLLIQTGIRPVIAAEADTFQELDARGWQGRRDSNPRPTVLETATLTS